MEPFRLAIRPQAIFEAKSDDFGPVIFAVKRKHFDWTIPSDMNIQARRGPVGFFVTLHPRLKTGSGRTRLKLRFTTRYILRAFFLGFTFEWCHRTNFERLDRVPTV